MNFYECIVSLEKTTEPFKNADEKEDESDVSDASQKDSECEKKKKSSYLNPLLKVYVRFKADFGLFNCLSDNEVRSYRAIVSC